MSSENSERVTLVELYAFVASLPSEAGIDSSAVIEAVEANGRAEIETRLVKNYNSEIFQKYLLENPDVAAAFANKSKQSAFYVTCALMNCESGVEQTESLIDAVEGKEKLGYMANTVVSMVGHHGLGRSDGERLLVKISQKEPSISPLLDALSKPSASAELVSAENGTARQAKGSMVQPS